MKKFAAILVVAILLTLPVLGFTQEENFENVKLEFKGYAEKPVIDGILDEFGYSKVDIKPGDVSYGGNDDDLEELAKAMKYDIYASYDEDYIYMFISMESKYYNNDGSGAWDQAGVQFGFSNVGEDEYVCEFMIGRDSDDGNLVITYFTQYADADDELKLDEGEDFQIVVDGDRVNHEVRIPVNTFYNGGKLKEGAQFTICIVLDAYDDGYIHAQISSGLSNGRNIGQFATVTLSGQMEGRPAEVVEEDVPEVNDGADEVVESAPATPAKTGDAGVITFAVVSIIAALGIVIFRIKTSVK